MKEYEAAIAIYTALLDELPAHPKMWLSFGHALKTAGHQDRAIAAYRQAIALAPDYADPWNGIGAVEIARDRPREAIPPLDRAIALAPGDPMLVLNRAVAYQLLDMRDLALRDYRAFVAASKGIPDLQPQRAVAITIMDGLTGRDAVASSRP